MYLQVQLLSANNSSRNLFFPIGPGEIPEHGDKEVIREPAMLIYLPVHLNLLPTSNAFGILPVMSFPSDSLPALWDFLALVRTFLCLLLQRHSCLLLGGSWWRLLMVVRGSAYQWDTLLSAAPLPHSRDPLDPLGRGFIQHSSLSSPTVAVLSREACALTHSTRFSRLHCIRLNETLNYQTSNLRISKQDKWMSCIRAWLYNPSSAEHLLLGTGRANRLRNKEAT